MTFSVSLHISGLVKRLTLALGGVGKVWKSVWSSVSHGGSNAKFAISLRILGLTLALGGVEKV